MWGNHAAAELVVGTIVTALAVALLVFFYIPERGDTLAGYALIGHLSKADGLHVGSDVRIAGIDVGHISRLDLNPVDYVVTVRFTVRNSIQIPTDSALDCASEGLLGGNAHLDIIPGKKKSLMRPGDVITKTQNCSGDLMSLIGQFGLGSSAAASRGQ